MYLMNQKESFDSDTCIIMLDIAENDQKFSHFIGITANLAFTQLLLLQRCIQCPSRAAIWFYIKRFKT